MNSHLWQKWAIELMWGGVIALRSLKEARKMCSSVLENNYKPQAVLRGVTACNAFVKSELISSRNNRVDFTGEVILGELKL